MDDRTLDRIAAALERIADVLEFRRDLEAARRQVAQLVRMEDIEKRRKRP